jgi:transmembrane sensor
MAERASRHKRSEPDVTTTAGRWVARHDRGLTGAELGEFTAWRAESPWHAHEFARLYAAWRAADSVKADPSLVAWAERIDLETRRQQRDRVARQPWVAWAAGLAAAAAVLVAVIAPGQRTSISASPSAIVPAKMAAAVELVPSAARRVVLSDGSIVELRGDSDIRPMFSVAERRVKLMHGEAHFTVEKMPTRPFIVEANGLAIRAVGTAFNVKLDNAAVEVLVTEGTISLNDTKPVSGSTAVASRAPMITAGERALIESAPRDVSLATMKIEPVPNADIERALSWQGARLILQRATLAEAIAVFNQYGRDRVELGDDALRSRRLSGMFRADNSEAFVRLLEQAAEVRVERRADGMILLYPAH